MEPRVGRQRYPIEEREQSSPPLSFPMFAALAALAAALFLLRLIPAPTWAVSLPLAVFVLIGVGARLWARRGVDHWQSMPRSDKYAVALGVLGAYAVCHHLERLTGAVWVWMVGAAVAVMIVLGAGYRYRRRFG